MQGDKKKKLKIKKHKQEDTDQQKTSGGISDKAFKLSKQLIQNKMEQIEIKLTKEVHHKK